jgi:hypothetical protein
MMYVGSMVFLCWLCWFLAKILEEINSLLNTEFWVLQNVTCSSHVFWQTKKQQYHCDACGICRIGGRENFFHCDRCGMLSLWHWYSGLLLSHWHRFLTILMDKCRSCNKLNKLLLYCIAYCRLAIVTGLSDNFYWFVSENGFSASIHLFMCWLQAAAMQSPCKMDTLVLRSLCTRIALCALRCSSCSPYCGNCICDDESFSTSGLKQHLWMFTDFHALHAL